MGVVLSHKPSFWTDRLAIAICTVLVILLVPLTLWKEDKLFWTNAGGYPEWLRECVFILYYPCWLFSAALLGMLGWSIIARFFGDFSFRRVWVAYAFDAGLFAMITLYVIVT